MMNNKNSSKGLLSITGKYYFMQRSKNRYVLRLFCIACEIKLNYVFSTCLETACMKGKQYCNLSLLEWDCYIFHFYNII